MDNIDPLSDNSRLTKQIHFLLELDKLKGVLRQSMVNAGSRQENSAEHSWHLAMTALVLHEYANEPVDLSRVLQMLLVHDIVEIDAGDTFIYDEKGQAARAEQERKAAQRIFNLLPPDQAKEMTALWEEFEARNTPDARFAAALDRLQAILQNHLTDGMAWKRHHIRQDQVITQNQRIADGATELWSLVEKIVERATRKGHLLPSDKNR